MKPTLSIKSSSPDKLEQLIRRVARTHVVVGIPKETASRDDGGQVNNAELGYIHEFGSEVGGIPPRPFLLPGVRNSKAEVQKKLRGALKAALHNDEEAAMALMGRAGSAASDSVKKAIKNGNFVPLKASTIANRFRGRHNKEPRPNEKPGSPNFGKGVKPLINTQDLLKSITYLVRKNGST